MRIGILSLNPGHNYGGILQSFALQTVLEGMGHEVSIICKDVYEKEPDIWHSYKYLSRICRMIRCGTSWEGTVIPERANNRLPKFIRQHTDCFMKKYLHRKFVNRFTDLNERDFDCIIVGSDQVWRKIYFEGQYSQPLCNAYLSFTDGWDVKRISYAASFGTDEWEYTDEDTIKCGELLRKFDAVTVREDSGVRLCLDKLGVRANKLIDPTLLLKADDYIDKLNLNCTPKSKGNLLVYVLDKNNVIDRLVKEISIDKGLIPFETNAKTDRYDIKQDPFPQVEKWLQGFRDAEFVVTDSFHACVFSVIFHKPFVVIGNKERGMTRFDSFLSQFELTDRMIYDYSSYEKLNNIDYSRIDVSLVTFQRESMMFLQSL